MSVSLNRSRWLRAAFAVCAAMSVSFVSQASGIVSTSSAWGAEALQTAPRITLRVLVIDDGQPMVRAIVAQLDREGVPYHLVKLSDPGRPRVTADFLRVIEAKGPRALYQAVVLPSHTPAGLSSDEIAELTAFESNFGIRQVSAYEWPSAAVGLAAPVFSGTLDGATGTVTPEAKAQGFGYLSGTMIFDDFDPQISESYAYLSVAAPGLPQGSSWTPFVTSTVGGASGSVIGVYTEGRREEMVLTVGQNEFQQHQAILTHGIVQWMTRGVHLGEYRNYLSVHVDDVFLPDAEWSIEGNCTIGNDCDPVKYPENSPGAASRMGPADVAFVRTWQANAGIKLDMTYNGAGVREYGQAHGGIDPTYLAFKQTPFQFRWINHTYSHPNLGCEQNTATFPWSCAIDAQGSVIYPSTSSITREISTNRTWGSLNLFLSNRAELVTGEHSGLASLPQMLQDNPNLGPALDAERVRWIASDASREWKQRAVTSKALTVPRYPMSVYYNTSTYAGAADEYNWIYTSRADGGSGLCEDRPEVMTCQAPLNIATGYLNSIVPQEARITLRHMTTSDPRPHYAHQSNLTGDRVLYPVLDSAIKSYTGMFAVKTTPIVNPTMSQAGQALKNAQQWSTSKDSVTAILESGTIRMTSGNVSTPVPVTAGMNTASTQLATAYAGSRSQWLTLAAGSTKTVTLSAADTYYPMTQNGPVVPVAVQPRPVARFLAPATQLLERDELAPSEVPVPREKP